MSRGCNCFRASYIIISSVWVFRVMVIFGFVFFLQLSYGVGVLSSDCLRVWVFFQVIVLGCGCSFK